MNSKGKPLVVRFGAFGDMVMVTPALEAAAKRAGQPCDLVSAGPWSETMFVDCPWVDRVYLLGSRRTPYWLSRDQQRLVGELRRREWGPTWVLDHLPKATELIRRAGCPANLLVRIADTPPSSARHDSEWAWRTVSRSPDGLLLSPLTRTAGSLRYDLVVGADRVEDSRRWLQSRGWRGEPIVCVQIGNKKTMKRGRIDRKSNLKYWPRENWLDVIRGVLLRQPDARVLLTGAPSEAYLTEDAARQVGDSRVASVARELHIPRLLGLLRLAHSCISVDTGTAHAAAAVGCPLAVLFGATDARSVQPLGAPGQVQAVIGRTVEHFDDDRDNWADCHDMSAIRPDQVLAAWLQLQAQAAAA